MKKEDLKRRIEDIKAKRGKAEFSIRTEAALNDISMLNELYIEIINEFNETTAVYNKRLFCLTFVMTILTAVLTFKTLLT